jgi:hypothetical protein
MSQSKIGVNLPPVAEYHSGARYYIDLMKTAIAPGSFEKIDSGDPGPLNDQGWPTSHHGVTVTSISRGCKGLLTVIAQGRLDAITVRASPDRARDLVYDRVANITRGVLPCTTEAVGLSLQIRGQGLGQIQLLRPGYETADEVFTRELIDALRPFGFARFMDALHTNTSANQIKTWADRPQVSDRSYSLRGMPWEHAIAIANRARVRPWLNMPYDADEDCCRKLAALVRDTLSEDLIPIFEFDNEGWGEHFEQGRRNALSAQEEQKTDAALRATPWGGGGDYNTWKWNRLAKRLVWLNTILLEVFGSRDKYRLLLNGQADSPQVLQVQLEYFKAIGKKPADVLDAVAIAPYADLKQPLADDPSLTPDVAFAPGNIDVKASGNEPTRKHQALCAANGLRCWVYEGGINSHNKPWGFKVPAVRAIQSDPRMGDAVEAYLDHWDFAGGALPDDRLFCFYNLQSPWLEEGPAANFGATQDVGDLSGPKIKALIAAAARHQQLASHEPADPARRVERVVVHFNDGTHFTIG